MRLQDLGYQQATDVQAQAIPLLLKGKDAAVQVRELGRLVILHARYQIEF